MKQHSKEKIQLVNELHRPVRRKYPRRRVIIKGFDESWESDIAQMDKFAKVNKNFKFILVVIDRYSKFMWALPLKTKGGVEVTHAFEGILKGRRPKNLQTDQGTEYYNSHFQKLMKMYNINHYSTFSGIKCAIAERSIRSIKERLYKYFSLNGTNKWIEILPEIVKDYNSRKHSKTKMRPIDVGPSTNLQIYKHLKIAGPSKLKIGDLVRISKTKHIFDKGYLPGWSTELFKIIKVKITNPVTYLLEDLTGRPIQGGFYEEELQKTSVPDVYLVEKVLQRKDNRLKVRWLGFDKTHDSWVRKSDIL